MNARERAVKQARKLISDDLLIEFFRAVRSDSNVLALQLINEQLDQGKTLNQIFYTGDNAGYLLSVNELPGSSFRISFGYQADPLAGDGGEWKVVFDAHGTISSLAPGDQWIS